MSDVVLTALLGGGLIGMSSNLGSASLERCFLAWLCRPSCWSIFGSVFLVVFGIRDAYPGPFSLAIGFIVSIRLATLALKAVDCIIKLRSYGIRTVGACAHACLVKPGAGPFT